MLIAGLAVIVNSWSGLEDGSIPDFHSVMTVAWQRRSQTIGRCGSSLTSFEVHGGHWSGVMDAQFRAKNVSGSHKLNKNKKLLRRLRSVIRISVYIRPATPRGEAPILRIGRQ